MDLGVTMFTTDRSMHPASLARAVEERGFASLYVPEHTHIPTARTTPPPTGEAELPEEYSRTLDPFVALSAAGAVTDRLRVGTGICLPAERDPIVTAKEVATLDHLTGGRFVFGIGFGWNVEEMADHGVDFMERRAVTRERVLAMKELWTEDRATYTGEYVSFEETWSWPKPVQRPHPPVLIGGAGGPKLFDAIADYGDGWMPIGGSGLTESIPRLREVVAGAGRDPDALHIVPVGTIPDAGKLEHYRDIGVTEVVVRLPSAPADQVLPVLDDYARLVGSF
ncbi:MAG: LLM class F420-dependent oxidoreductase [Acidimicrobiia bacterium]